MMTAAEEEFRVCHEQPVGLDTLMGLDVETLAGEMSRLKDSVERLERSNEEMVVFEAEDPASAPLLRQARQENLQTIACQKERVEMIKWTVRKKLRPPGSTHNDHSHYNSDHLGPIRNDASKKPSPTGSHPDSSQVPGSVELDSDEGLSL